MQIVIDIDSYVLEHCKRHVKEHYATNIEEAIANGTPLPKGHGRLIDADELNEQEIPAIKKDDVVYVKLSTLQDLIDNAPTIIEAESEG